MDLDDRKLKILQAVIKNYLETGEPVGSRTISKYTDLNLSSATIRNEMADLEELGYIIQPHTSAGRIPTDKGYRLYVDTLMQEKVDEVNNMRDDLLEKADRMENLLQQVAKMLAVNTNYATMVTTPKYRSRKIKFIQLTDVDEYQVLAVIVLEGNIVKNRMFRSDVALVKEDVLKLNLALNTFLQGLDIEEINIGLVQKLKSQVGSYQELVSEILDAIATAIQEEGDIRVYTSGATNILKYPELSDMNKALDILSTLENKEELTQFVENGDIQPDEKRGIQVYIGDENKVDSMKDCSVVTATYEIEEGIYGKVGIIGPKRMDYERVVGTLQNMMGQLDDIFKNKKP
ncbi:MAG: heat-inducible transcriptional repressor HrcA [Lachnospiraceae bacterium]|nr:heat-inducible transcriptional repressor HrcA [Lachnospiraceae bacterium]